MNRNKKEGKKLSYFGSIVELYYREKWRDASTLYFWPDGERSKKCGEVLGIGLLHGKRN